MTNTIPAPPPTAPSNPVPCRDDVLSVEWRGRTLLIPRIGIGSWRRDARMSVGLTGFVSADKWSGSNRADIVISITEVTMTRRCTMTSRATADLGTNIADLLTDACEGIDRIPDEFWELMAAPLEGASE